MMPRGGFVDHVTKRILASFGLISTESHHGTGHRCDEFSVGLENVAGVVTDGFATVNRLGDGPNFLIPNRSKEIDSKIDGRAGLALLQGCEVSRPNGGIGQVCENAAMNRAHGIGMKFHIRLHFNRRGAIADLDKFKSKRLRDWRRINHSGSIFGR